MLFSTCIPKHYLQKQVVTVFIKMPSRQKRLASGMEKLMISMSYP